MKIMQGINSNSQPVRNKKKKKIEKTHAKEKQSHVQDSIYVDWQFAYVHRVAGISLLSGKSTKHGYSFSLTHNSFSPLVLLSHNPVDTWVSTTGFVVQGISPKSQPVRKKKQRKHTPKESNHMHKTIFTWFGNLPTSIELQGFHYYQEKKKYKVRLQYFSLSF